jgi:predicted butyrate kinase (DUF1464 family)
MMNDVDKRLEELEKYWKRNHLVDRYQGLNQFELKDIKWLISQLKKERGISNKRKTMFLDEVLRNEDLEEQLQQLQQENERLKDSLKGSAVIVNIAQEKNDVYEKALNKIAYDESTQFFEWCPKVAREALGDS